MDENSKSKWGGGEIKKEIGGLPQFWSQAEWASRWTVEWSRPPSSTLLFCVESRLGARWSEWSASHSCYYSILVPPREKGSPVTRNEWLTSLQPPPLPMGKKASFIVRTRVAEPVWA
jgi:hypothetical protein